MKILIIGLGSIGQRHLRNLYKINPKFKFIAVRKIFKVPILTNSLKISKNTKNLKEKYNIKYHKSLDLALKEKPDFILTILLLDLTSQSSGIFPISVFLKITFLYPEKRKLMNHSL